jgi:hypothetical protein
VATDEAGKPVKVTPQQTVTGLPQQNSTENFAESDVAAFLRSVGLLRQKPLDTRDTEPLRRAAQEAAQQAARENPPGGPEPQHDPDAEQAYFRVFRGRPSKGPDVADNPPSKSFSETNAWIYGGIGGAAFSTVLGIGLVGIFYEHEPIAGTAMSLIGLAGLSAMIFLLKGHRLTVIHTAIAALIATWVFLGYVLWFGPHPTPAPTGRVWATLTSNEKTLLTLAIKVIPKRERFRVICLTTDCKDLATDFMGAFHDAGWNPILATGNSFYQEPYGLILYMKDVNDHSLADAIEKTTSLKVDHIEQSTDPFAESIALGIRP